DQAAEELLELSFVLDLEQGSRLLHLLELVEHRLVVALPSALLRQFVLGFVTAIGFAVAVGFAVAFTFVVALCVRLFLELVRLGLELGVGGLEFLERAIQIVHDGPPRSYAMSHSAVVRRLSSNRAARNAADWTPAAKGASQEVFRSAEAAKCASPCRRGRAPSIGPMTSAAAWRRR